MNTQMIITEFQTKITMVTTVEYDIWYKGSDIASILKYANPRDALKEHVDFQDKNKLEDIPISDTNCSEIIDENIIFINERGVRSLLFKSKLHDSINVLKASGVELELFS